MYVKVGCCLIQTNNREILKFQKLNMDSLNWRLHAWCDKLKLLKNQMTLFDFEYSSFSSKLLFCKTLNVVIL